MYIDRQKKDNPIEDASTAEKPLVVLKFQKRRMLWRLFFPYSMGLLLFFDLLIIVAAEKSMFKFVFFSFIFGVAFVGLLYAIVNMLMMKQIRLYKDRIVQKFRLSKNERVIYLNNAKFSSITAFFMTFITIANIDRRWNKITFDSRLIGTGEKKNFYEILSELTGRSIAELKNKYFTEKLNKQEGDNGRQ